MDLCEVLLLNEFVNLFFLYFLAEIISSPISNSMLMSESLASKMSNSHVCDVLINVYT